ncbi:DUF4330 domain-containing protein [Tepidibacter thalassicus]|uniref:DUF4330 domain-containing protein n=1 Tax=Tepidibacter thalassicus DSM 15285 TaxID=1123350 RepID=A0A1M5TDZ4_9FIRM|nr:DUF4330 domain-containing protein [Tepidibacter thalassicus]SHH48533.1 protein of unknown function [Tepidibacter thalassicus DSM 15285]
MKGKKINIIDISIILLVLLVAVGGYKIISSKNNQNQYENKVYYDVEFKLKDKNLFDYININDTVKDSKTGSYLGKIVDKKIIKSTKITENKEQGRFEKTVIPDKYDILLTVEANGIIGENNIIAEGTEIRVGKLMYIKGKGYASKGFITGIRFEE